MTRNSTVDGWLRTAVEDAERRGMPELKPLLETLARSTAGLRDADRQTRAEEDGSSQARNGRDG
jgi:hypothetical protein